MRYLFFSILVLLNTVSFANSFANNALLSLCEVNKEWLKQPEKFSAIQQANFAAPKNFNEWIAVHLMLVETTLRQRDIRHLSALQISHRTALLDKLQQYHQAGVFPINDYLPYKNPIFIDRIGTHCAVGYLMQQSGAEDLAQQIDREQKYAYVHEIKVNGVAEWAAKNGFTLDELAWIQPGYPVQSNAQDMEGGLNGPVNAIAIDPINQTIFAGGDFTQSTKGANCQNIAAYISGFAGFDWISIGGNLDGAVHALLVYNNKLYVGGSFTSANGQTANRVAVYDLLSSQWQTLSGLDSTVKVLAVYNGDIYAGGDFTGFVAKWNGTSWQDVTQGFLYGNGVRTLEVFDNKLIIGGDFELATGALRKHVASYDGTFMGSVGFGTTTPVNDFTIRNGKLIAGCDVISGNDTCALAEFDNNDWQVLLRSNTFIGAEFVGVSIKSVQAYNDKIIAGGEFTCGSMMTYGNNLMTFSQTLFDTTLYTSCEPLTLLNASINQVLLHGNQLYFGGQFATNLSDTLNHIAYLNFEPTNIPKVEPNAAKLMVYPNPTSDALMIENKNIQAIELIDAQGKIVLRHACYKSGERTNVKGLAAGVYLLRAKADNTWLVSQWIKQ
jgi:hypothetical protein